MCALHLHRPNRAGLRAPLLDRGRRDALLDAVHKTEALTRAKPPPAVNAASSAPAAPDAAGTERGL